MHAGGAFSNYLKHFIIIIVTRSNFGRETRHGISVGFVLKRRSVTCSLGERNILFLQPYFRALVLFPQVDFLIFLEEYL
jgi:hypothetical protein